jgi:hypothetical protein
VVFRDSTRVLIGAEVLTGVTGEAFRIKEVFRTAKDMEILVAPKAPPSRRKR